MSEINELLERVKAATGPDRGLDADIDVALFGGETVWKQSNGTMDSHPSTKRPSKMHHGGFAFEMVPLVTGFIDHALGSAMRALPEHRFAIFTNGGGQGPTCIICIGDEPVVAAEVGPDIPLAILAALLTAIRGARN